MAKVDDRGKSRIFLRMNRRVPVPWREDRPLGLTDGTPYANNGIMTGDEEEVEEPPPKPPGGKAMETTTKRAAVKASSGNVFADVRLPNPREALAKAQLAERICDTIAASQLTQTEAAELLGLDQPKISALVRGKLSGFSTDRLFRLLNDLGQEIEIVIRPAKPAHRRGAIHVLAAGKSSNGRRAL